MKVSTNVKPRKKKTNVTDTFKKAEEQAKEKYAAESESAKKYDESLKKKSTGFQVKTGRVSQQDLAASGAYTGKKIKNYSETQRVEGLKQTGFYDPKPAVTGGTKKMLVRAKKNVKKSAASASAKKAAKRLY